MLKCPGSSAKMFKYWAPRTAKLRMLICPESPTVTAPGSPPGYSIIHPDYNAFAAIRDDGSVVTWGDSEAGGDSSSVQGRLRAVVQIQATR